jgi:Tol biopolymer transport system component
MNYLAVLTFLVSCNLDSNIGPDDAPPVDTNVDPDTTPAPCNLAMPFQAPVRFNFDSSGLDKSQIWLTDDELTAYVTAFTSKQQIFTASRASRAVPEGDFGPTTLSEVTDPDEGERATVTSDGLTIMFGTSRTGTTGQVDLFSSTRSNAQQAFPPPTVVDNINSTAIDQAPFLTRDGLELYFASNRTGAFAIYQAKRTSVTIPFAAPTLIDLGGGATSPVLSPDGLDLYFSSTRAGGNGLEDIWVAHRATTASTTFETAENVTQLNDDQNNFANWMSFDGCRMYTSRLVTGIGSRVHVATRPN